MFINNYDEANKHFIRDPETLFTGTKYEFQYFTIRINEKKRKKTLKFREKKVAVAKIYRFNQIPEPITMARP